MILLRVESKALFWLSISCSTVQPMCFREAHLIRRKPPEIILTSGGAPVFFANASNKFSFELESDVSELQEASRFIKNKKKRKSSKSR